MFSYSWFSDSYYLQSTFLYDFIYIIFKTKQNWSIVINFQQWYLPLAGQDHERVASEMLVVFSSLSGRLCIDLQVCISVNCWLTNILTTFKIFIASTAAPETIVKIGSFLWYFKNAPYSFLSSLENWVGNLVLICFITKEPWSVFDFNRKVGTVLESFDRLLWKKLWRLTLFLPYVLSFLSPELVSSDVIVTQGSLVPCLSALLLSGGQAFGEWAFAKIGGLFCYLIVEMTNIVEWITHNGPLTAEGKGTSSWKETLLRSQRSLLGRAVPSAGASFNTHRSPSAGKLPFSKGGMIKQERNALLAVQVVRKGRRNIRDLCC